MNCEIISVGTELLLGNIVNTNMRFLAEILSEMGINLLFESTVGDNEERLMQTYANALKRSDLIITSGGLGPTEDDLTKETFCKECELNMVLHEPTFEKIKTYFESKGLDLTYTQKKQAMFPEGSILFSNDNGTAPGFALENGNKIIIMLPGPPYEMQPMVENYVVPYLKSKFERVIYSETINIFGIGEGKVAEGISDLTNSQNPTIATYAKPNEVQIRVTASAENKKEAKQMLVPIIKDLQGRFGENIYGINVENLQSVVVDELKKRKNKIAIAESCTAGLVAKKITDVSGASDVFELGIVTYSNEMKNKFLNVPNQTIQSFGAVSAETASAMAEGVRKAGNADIGISLTGIAGPSGGTEEKPVGLVYIALSNGKNIWVKKILAGKNDREYIRNLSSLNALDLVRKYLTGVDNGLQILENDHLIAKYDI